MPELTATTILFGLLVALLSWMIVNASSPSRRLPIWGAAIVGGGAVFLAAPVLDFAQQTLGSTAGRFEVSGDALFIGLWFGIIAITVFERKGQPRRVPIWAGVAVGLVATFGVPPLLDRLTGKYQNASLRADVNHCMQTVSGDSSTRNVSNGCEHPIVVGLCLSSERNPAPCAQAVELAPGKATTLDSKGEQRSSLPSNANGYTLVACRPPDRPSRTKKVGGKGHRGVCLPAE